LELKVREVARLLNVAEDTVYRWARKGTLPAHRVHDQFLFNRVELQEWAAVHKHKVSPELFAAADDSQDGSPDLLSAIERGGITHDLPGATREEVLSAIARLPGIPSRVNRDLLHQLLLAREALASTSIGDGIAIPHPRDPVVVHVARPFVFLCFLRGAVDFGAPDGEPVRVVFLLLSPSVRDHLRLLAKLAAALHDEALKKLLHAAVPPREILDRVAAIEKSALRKAGT
jgi:PTS system nitrogen regulatory IIA component